MTVYEHCKEESDICRVCANKAFTKRMHDHLLADAEMWESRAGRLSVEDGSRDVKDVVLYKLFEVKEAVSEEVETIDHDYDTDIDEE